MFLKFLKTIDIKLIFTATFTFPAEQHFVLWRYYKNSQSKFYDLKKLLS